MSVCMVVTVSKCACVRCDAHSASSYRCTKVVRTGVETETHGVSLLVRNDLIS